MTASEMTTDHRSSLSERPREILVFDARRKKPHHQTHILFHTQRAGHLKTPAQ